MADVSRSMWSATRTEASGRQGAVAAKHDLAATVGIEMLRGGGNAVDAAVAMAFTLAVVEPYMSGLGGGGFMVLHDGARGESHVIDFGVISPQAATPDMFEMVAGGEPAGFFGWDAVVDDANIVGHRSVAVPGAVAGLLLAHERFGSLPLAQLLEPAIGYAQDGVAVDWFTSYMIGMSFHELSRFPSSSAVFTARGRPLVPEHGEPGDRLVQRDLAETLRRIAAGGVAAFYRGTFAEALHDEMQRHGGLVTRDDLAAYRPRIHTPGLLGCYRGHTLVGVPAPSGGPTVFQTLGLLHRFDMRALGHNSAPALHVMAEAGRKAFADRFAHLADRPGDTAGQLLDASYLDRVAAAIDPHGKRAALPTIAPAPDARERTTTTLATADALGNAVALTTTLLSGFGSAVTIEGTGVLMNNGMMWFDPRPGYPNSVGPGKRPLNNMSPVLVLHEGRPHMVVGAMGGRRIIGAVATIISNALDYGMTMQDACAAPRLDLSTGAIRADPRIPESILDDLSERGHTIRVLEDTFGAFEYGSPAAVLIEADGLMRTGVDPLNPAAAAAF